MAGLRVDSTLRRGAAVVVLLGVAAWLVWWLRACDTIVPPAGPEATDAAPRDAAGPAAGTTTSSHRTPVAPPPPAAAPAPAHVDLDDKPRQVGPGEVAVQVLRGREPVVGATVRLWTNVARPAMKDPGRDGTPPSRAATSDAEGRVTFVGLAAGDVAVRADVGAHWRIERARVDAAGNTPRQARTIVLRFGSATILGQAVDENGAALVGWTVHSHELGDSGGTATQTAADGTFVFAGMPAGRHWVQLEQRGEWTGDRERQLTLLDGETARCNFGPVAAAGTLSGRVVDGLGTTIPGRRTLRVAHREHNDERRLFTAEDGTFTAHLPQGAWVLWDGDDHRTDVLATFEQGTFATVDVPWPGMRLLGVVMTTQPLDGDDLRRSTYLRGPTGVVQADSAFVQDGQLHLQWLGLRAGDYVLQPQGTFHFVDAPRAGIGVSLHADRPVHSLILKIEPR